MSTQTGGWDSAVEVQNQAPGGASPRGRGSVLVDQSERVVATIGSNYLQNFLSGGSVGKGIGVLTQKRFYYKGRNYAGSGKEVKSITQQGVVSIEDITFTMFTHVRNTGYLIAAVLLTLAAGFSFLLLLMSDLELFFLGADVASLAAIFFYIVYFVMRTSVFQISFPGGSFGFDIRWYPISDIRDFQRQLHLLKDHKKESAAV